MMIGAILIVVFGKRFFKPKRSVNMVEWMYRIENAGALMLHDELCAVQSKAAFFDLVNIEEIPRDFEPTIFLTSNVTANIQRIVLLRLEAEGIVTQGTFEAMFPNAAPKAAEVAAAEAPEAVLVASARASVAPTSKDSTAPPSLRLVTPAGEPDHDWIDGRIVPKISAG